MKPIYILHYEDTPSYRESFKILAQKNRMLVDSVDNVDELIELLEENPRKHKFVVLDARAYLHEGQGPGSENEANLHKVFRDIVSISKTQDRIIPFCINTGFADIKLHYESVLQCKIFEKGKENDLFEFIWETYNNSDGGKLRSDYPELYEFADLYFEDVNMEVLSSILIRKKFESNKITDIVSTLSSLRRLLEHTMDIIFKKYLGEQNGIIKNKASRASDILNYLNNNQSVPPQVFGAAIIILRTASNYGSHTPEQAAEIRDYPTKDSIIGLTYGFFEIIRWSNKIIA
jgi:hypothetical protein